jgi:hypothetical protein
MNTALTIPDNISTLSRWEQVSLFHQHGDLVIPLHLSGGKFNTPVDKKKKRLSDHDLFRHFGNGAHLNIGVIPKSGEIVVDLDGDTLDYVLRFLDSNSELANVPRVQTARGCHLRFRCGDLPASIRESGYLAQPAIVRGVNFELFSIDFLVVQMRLSVSA